MTSSWIKGGWVPIFPPEEAWEPERKAVRFPVRLVDRTYTCRITLEALVHRYDATGDGEAALTAFRENRAAIEDEVRRKMRRGQYQPDRSVLIRGSDL